MEEGSRVGAEMDMEGERVKDRSGGSHWRDPPHPPVNLS